MKFSKLIIVFTFFSVLLTGCACKHEVWIDATCTEPKTCQECGATEGETIEHKWIDANCETPKTCNVCGEIEGQPLGHKWIDATCTEPKTCEYCGITTGNALGHDWADATCIEAITCINCSETKGKALGHKIDEWEVENEPTCAEEGTEIGTCNVCERTIKQKIDKVEHTLGEWVITKEPTSYSKGLKEQKCTVCDTSVNEEQFEWTEEEIIANYKAKCLGYSYEEIARDPDGYKGTFGKYTGKVIQVLEEGSIVAMRINITQTRYSYTDTIYVLYVKDSNESRILEDDIVTIYGENNGLYSYKSVLGATISLPCVVANYVDR